jgi:ABC-type hemin transport system ATPase subunit
MVGGRAAATGPPEVVLEESLLSSVFGCDVVVDKSEPGRRPLVRLSWRT